VPTDEPPTPAPTLPPPAPTPEPPAPELETTTAKETTIAPAEKEEDTGEEEDDTGDEFDYDAPGTGECGEPGDDCRQSKCCKDSGMQCYMKSPKYATCHASCDPNEPDEEDGKKWSCKKLGERTPREHGNFDSCPVAGDNCADQQCCRDPGFKCYKKDKYFSSCKTTCEAGKEDSPGDGAWECQELGERTPWPPEMQRCQWPADNCIISKCCKMPETTCFKQDEYFASCKAFLDKEKWDADWDGEELGGVNTSIDNPVSAAAEGEAAGDSLYCIVVVTPGYTAEEDLVAQQEAAGVHVWACDGSDKLQGQMVGKGDWQSVQNTAVFVDIWNQVHDKGTYQSFDWTVKVDPDAVFFPDRLKGKIQAIQAPRDFPLYLKNCGFKLGFMGSLEIFSKAAIDLYSENQGDCLVNIGTDGGEDFYMKTCLDAIGAGHMEDTTLLRDRYDFESFPGDFNAAGLDDCSDGGAVAYHPHKTWDKWQECKSMSEGAGSSWQDGRL
jgi:hypothetical protein